MTEINPPEFGTFGKHLFTTFVIIFGAIVHATVKLKVARENGDGRFNSIDYVILFIVASFAGMIFSFLARYFFDNEYMINLCASVGAFLGIAGINTVGYALLGTMTRKIPKV